VTDERQRFEALFRAHYPALTRYAVRRVGENAAAEIVAEAFLIAWRRLDDVPDEPLPWLYGVARRVIANERRRRGRADRLVDRIGGERVAPPGDPADLVGDRLRIRTALDRLSARDREVLLLAEWERLPPADAAQVLGCSTATYHVRLHRARRRIADLLRTDEDPAPVRPHLLTEETTP